ncbi:ATP-dependent DNA helicase RecG [Lautropia mirabilis ATCC 51599]|uniref:ATP-dependent DNA helicase RecG n=1 Tax=Lautropia mirabilis ATCC 51599 TaxID=887898 RepID=E7RXE9_9BURK|nr:ATP-dependent DNA helicase RecG [Lautropia mirabilis]EFV94945.1 ATP-dependent DNA helicase RecG [Lautropia mirabilis ATCC 51599]VEH01425.1 ATP-dependent DNA helicase recG [Lautropia mirabilis]
MKNVRKAGAAVEGAEAPGKEAAGGRTAKGAAKTSSGRRSAASLLARLGLHGPDDLVLHLPLRYEDETRLVPIGSLVHGSSAQIQATVTRAEVTRGRRALQVWVNDGTGELQLRFLHFYPSQLTQLQPGRLVRAYGELRVGLFGREMVHPRYRMVSEDTPLPDRLTPVYPTVAGLGQATLRREIDRALADCRWQDTLPPTLLTALMSGSGDGKQASGRPGADPVASLLAGLPPLLESLRLIHHPPPGTDLDALLERRTPACQRIVLEELVAQQLSLRRARQLRAGQRGQPLANRDGEAALLASLPFALTGAQRRVCDEIAADLARQQPMNRLLQGDVGSGKTVIAALAAMVAVGSGWQATLMAPTEILARQHYERLSPWLEPLGVRVGWLAGSLGAAAKRRVKQAVAAGEVDVLIGTHALIEDSVVFPRLALAIVDEQHRFGVAQRLALRGEGTRDAGTAAEEPERAGATQDTAQAAAGQDGRVRSAAEGHAGEDGFLPHQLMMTATPIPRTLAMTFYADLDVSVIDELPPGRQPVTTKLIADSRRDQVVENVGRWVAEGRQAYWVCPLVEESEALDLQNAIDTREQLQAALPQVRTGLVHGRLSAAEKDEVMAAFKAGELDLLVATTVIEVGVDVPNASLMVIEHAERFGLSQLHQLRGRVGRGTAQSLCVLLYRHPPGAIARERLATMRETQDGFEIARRDLELRGPGELLGARQSGAMLLRFADLGRDAPLVDIAHALSERLLEARPDVVEAHLDRWLRRRERFLDA